MTPTSKEMSAIAARLRDQGAAWTTFVVDEHCGNTSNNRVGISPAAPMPEGDTPGPTVYRPCWLRNLQEVFGENDPARRRAATEELYTEDGVFYDPSKGVCRGRDEIDCLAGAIRVTHPDFRYPPIAEPEEVGNRGRVQWVSGRPGEKPDYAGTDFIIARDGRIAALYFFFDKLT
jgi:hypothetical protein